MSSKLKFLIPNKKAAIMFVSLSIVMGIASLQGEEFSEKEPSMIYKTLSWAVTPAWTVWLYVSAPVLYFFGITPQSSVRWFNLESWDAVYGLNFAYYYLVSVGVAEIWNRISHWRIGK